MLQIHGLPMIKKFLYLATNSVLFVLVSALITIPFLILTPTDTSIAFFLYAGITLLGYFVSATFNMERRMNQFHNLSISFYASLSIWGNSLRKRWQQYIKPNDLALLNACSDCNIVFSIHV